MVSVVTIIVALFAIVGAAGLYRQADSETKQIVQGVTLVYGIAGVGFLAGLGLVKTFAETTVGALIMMVVPAVTGMLLGAEALWRFGFDDSFIFD